MTSGATLCNGDGFREEWASDCSEPKMRKLTRSTGSGFPLGSLWMLLSPRLKPRGSKVLRSWQRAPGLGAAWREPTQRCASGACEAMLEGHDGRWGTWGADLSLSDQVSLLSSFSLTAAAQPGKHPRLLLLPCRSGEEGAGGV